MTMLPNIEEAMEDARDGKLSPYWQNNLKRECLHRKLTAGAFGTESHFVRDSAMERRRRTVYRNGEHRWQGSLLSLLG